MKRIKFFERFLAVCCYLGIIGVVAYWITKDRDKDEYISNHAREGSIIFIVSLLIVPILKLINRYYFYMLSSLSGLVAISVYIILIILVIINIIRAIKGLNAISFSHLFDEIFFRTAST